MADIQLNLPHRLRRNPKPGDLYSPNRGEHKGHVIQFLSADGVRRNILGNPLVSNLVRCRDCLKSWVFPDDATDC